MVIIETERLILRTWVDVDLRPFTWMNQNPQVMEFFPKLLTPDETAKLYERNTTRMKESGFGLYAAEFKHTREFAGFIGFAEPTFSSFFTPCVEIGWRLDKRFWKKGLATEGAKACLEYGFSVLHFKEIFSFTSKLNIRSIAVMKRIGMEYNGEFEHPGVE